MPPFKVSGNGSITSGGRGLDDLDEVGPEVDTSGTKSPTMLTVFIKGPSGKLLLAGANGALSFGSSHEQSARWNLLDSGDGFGNIYIQSASRDTSHYLGETSDGIVTQIMPDGWKLEAAGDGKVKIKSETNSNYLKEESGTLLVSTDPPWVAGANDNSKFTVTCIAVGWGQSPSKPPSASSVKLHITGRGGKNLMAGVGSVQMSEHWAAPETWTMIDSGDGRCYLKSSSGTYLRDNDGVLDTTGWTGLPWVDANLKWWPAYEHRGEMSFESNRGKYLVDNEGTASISSAATYHIGTAKKFTVTLNLVNFQLR
jgi:hypothetical protein